MNMKDIYNDLPTIETERLMLRKLTINDVEDIFTYGSNRNVTKYLFWDTHKSKADTTEFVQFAVNQYKNGQIAPWGIEHKMDQKLIGTIDFVRWLPNYYLAEIGYVIAPDYWRQGIATEAVKELIKFGFNRMGLVRIEAKCFVENIGSAKVMEKAAMTFEGVIRKGIFAKGRHWDLSLYSILKEEFF